jgi:predicted aldo/keto reductase-like oxidoreductase
MNSEPIPSYDVHGRSGLSERFSGSSQVHITIEGDPMSRKTQSNLSRRAFLKAGGAVAATTALPAVAQVDDLDAPDGPSVKIARHRVLGRTGFKVSDISIGGAANDANVVRFAYDAGINYFDTAETYGNGDSERYIGEAMQFMDRSKIFITTKLVMKDEDTEQTILERFGKCQERLKTDHVDALYMHSVENVALLDKPEFHAAVKKLKADGRLKHAGVSCHGPRGQEGKDSMEKVLVAAAEDGRFDLMLLSYNFLNDAEAKTVLAACTKHNVGTTAMKTAPASLEIDPFDPDNPSEEYAGYIKRMVEGGRTREEAVERIQRYVKRQQDSLAEARPFIDKHGLTSNAELRKLSIQWVLADPDMHTVCVGIRDFDDVNTFVPLSGTSLDRAGVELLRDYRLAYSRQYCRHGCVECVGACPYQLPVSTIMRYSYYFHAQGREKHAMQRYAALGDSNASLCLVCDAPCSGACPHGVSVQAHLLKAHSLLRMA